jgi:3-hydroxyisobutyrate dehydrogenase
MTVANAVTVLGTGIMGAGMARSLLRAGLDVTVWNRSADKARPLADDGATVAADVTDAVRGADVVVTMLFDADAVAEVMTTALPAFGGDTVWVQSSTVGLDGVARLADLAARQDVPFVDAPVLGTRQPAEEGKLIALVGGPAALRHTVAPVLDAIAARTVWVGEQPGDGHRLKLVANSWVVSVVADTAQSVALAAGLGLEPQRFLDVISGGPLDSAYAQQKGHAMIDGDHTPSFTLGGAVKDIELILAAMRATGTDDRVMAGQQAVFRAAQDAGHGQEDISAVHLAMRANTA